MKRAFIMVLDSFGIGATEDADRFGDVGADTLGHIAEACAKGEADHGRKGPLNLPNLTRLGLVKAHEGSTGKIAAGMDGNAEVIGAYAWAHELSSGKDTPSGHWEIAGVPVLFDWGYFSDHENSFPQELLDKLVKRANLPGYLGNCHSSGTVILDQLGEEHMKTGALIVYTSADSVFQVAANEAVVPVPELYRYCEIAREMLTGDHNVGRVIARPFVGTNAKDFKRTTNRHDLSLKPPRKTMLDYIRAAGLDTIGVGKIYDIFDGEGVSEKLKTTGNANGMEVTLELAQRGFSGLAFVNLVDFDMVYGHRNDVDGYANAATEFDGQLAKLLPLLRAEDLLIITADHGCDPATPSTDHSREYVPMLAYGKGVRAGADLGTRRSFACIAQTVCEYLGVPVQLDGKSFLKEILR